MSLTILECYHFGYSVDKTATLTGRAISTIERRFSQMKTFNALLGNEDSILILDTFFTIEKATEIERQLFEALESKNYPLSRKLQNVYSSFCAKY